MYTVWTSTPSRFNKKTFPLFYPCRNSFSEAFLFQNSFATQKGNKDKTQSLKIFFGNPSLSQTRKIISKILFQTKYNFRNIQVNRYFTKSCVTKSSQDLGNHMTWDLWCFYLGSVSTLISVPDLETMFQAFSKKTFSLSGCDLDFLAWQNLHKNLIKINTINTKTLVALLGGLKSIMHWSSS